MQNLIIIILLLVSSVANAFEVGTFKSSYHFINGPFNEKNDGVYIIDDDIHYGFFKNSYHDTALFVSGVRKLKLNNNLDLKLSAGVIYGYGPKLTDANGTPVLQLLVIPTITYEYNNFTLNTHFLGVAIGWSIGYKI